MLQAPGRGQSDCSGGALVRASLDSERAGGSARSLAMTENLDKSSHNHPVGWDTTAIIPGQGMGAPGTISLIKEG